MSRSRAYALAGFRILLFLGVVGGLFFLADLKQLGSVISNLRTSYLLLAAVTAVLSHFFNYLAFRGLASAADCAVKGGHLFRIAFASATVSCLFSAGGVSGMTLRLYFLGKQVSGPILERIGTRLSSPGFQRRLTDEKLASFRQEFHEATALITSHRRKIAAPFLYLAPDWAAAA